MDVPVFNPGDRVVKLARPIGPGPGSEKWRIKNQVKPGQIGTVIRYIGMLPLQDSRRVPEAYEIIWDGTGKVLPVSAYFLQRIDEHYDGNEKTTWDDCPFKPKELTRVENPTCSEE